MCICACKRHFPRSIIYMQFAHTLNHIPTHSYYVIIPAILDHAIDAVGWTADETILVAGDRYVCKLIGLRSYPQSPGH